MIVMRLCAFAVAVCVEASPAFSEAYQQLRKCKLVSRCLSNEPRVVAWGVGSDFGSQNGILKTNSNLKKKGHTYKTINMTCTTGARVFAEAGLTHVDWLSLDAEGHELAILQGIDWTAVTIDIITYEDNRVQRTAVAEFMSEKLGYRWVGIIGVDKVWLRPGFDLRDPRAATSSPYDMYL